ncbi:DUF4255 domain-containing protein [Permianibacter sp. IMCC34836]|uniref:DUF4255 domain-containing protein n=1 Tax=Permianibacter fluminis TaxID=2738515 RepID=UPI0015567AC2|nr:DUF4255 domain-containing protein [Permianibacter fluminis]NQD38320.1 DUF4255 domain-containing protein [Permianibacter fluminis]
MLDVTLKFLAKELNTYLLLRTGSNFGEVELCQPVDDSGKWAIKEDVLGLSLINIEEERILRSQLPETTYLNGQHVVLQPPLKLNLHVLFSARFKQYDQALRQLSHVLTFFQSHLLFTPDHYPGLDPRIEKLTLELLSPSYEQLNQIWAFIGGKQLPSVIYRLRMAVLQDVETSAIQPPLTEINTVLQQP